MQDFDIGVFHRRAPLFDDRRIAKDRRQFWRDKAQSDRREEFKTSK